jgi:hypothetical protein
MLDFGKGRASAPAQTVPLYRRAGLVGRPCLITSDDSPGDIRNLDAHSHSDERRSHRIGKQALCGYNHSGRKPKQRSQRSKLGTVGRAALRMRFLPQQGCRVQQVQ